ncbi:hypothetical protein OG528_36975 [Streptomyces platensis]|uniref:hypothetical protein n=1 Tax=Streptomyces platensis TaxID=58346 RepID=UPI0030E0183D
MRYRFSENEQFNYEILLALRATWRQGADVGEVLTAASATTDGDAETWLSTWATLARSVHARAERCAAHGRAVSARDAYLRAAGYFGTALVAVDGCADPEARLAELFRRTATGRLPGGRRRASALRADGPRPVRAAGLRLAGRAPGLRPPGAGLIRTIRISCRTPSPAGVHWAVR